MTGREWVEPQERQRWASIMSESMLKGMAETFMAGLRGVIMNLLARECQHVSIFVSVASAIPSRGGLGCCMKVPHGTPSLKARGFSQAQGPSLSPLPAVSRESTGNGME